MNKKPTTNTAPERIELGSDFGPITMPGDSTGAREAIRTALAYARGDLDALPADDASTPSSPAIRNITREDIDATFVIDASNSIRIPMDAFGDNKEVSRLCFEILAENRYFVMLVGGMPALCRMARDEMEILATLDEREIPALPIDGLAVTNFGDFLLLSKCDDDSPWTEDKSYDCRLQMTDPFNSYQLEKALRRSERAALVNAKAATLKKVLDLIPDSLNSVEWAELCDGFCARIGKAIFPGRN